LNTVNSEEHIRSELTGNTLRVYWYILKSKNGQVGMRETQKQLKFSSPNLALHHLEKLRRLDLIEKREGYYQLTKEVKVDTIKQFTRLGTLMVPRFLFYSVLFIMLLVYFVLNIQIFNFYSVYALIFGVLGIIVFSFETVKVLREQP
jgi:hypothetical protein